MKTETREHAEFAPSALSRIMMCPGSVQRCKGIPEGPETPWAAEGTLLHEYMVDAIKVFYADNFADHLITYKNSRDISDEHWNLVVDVLEWLEDNFPRDMPKRLIQDVRVYVNADVHGTLDLAVITEDAVHVIDFKFGAGVLVEVENNPQLLAYLLGLLNTLESTDYAAKNLYIHIVQPRRNHYARERVFPEELVYFEERLLKTVTIAKLPNPIFRPGEKQCRWCPAGATCVDRIRQLEEDAASLLTAFADETEPDMTRVSNAELAELLKKEDAVTGTFKAIRAHLYMEAYAGNRVPGYKLVAGRGSRKWDAGVDVDTVCDFFFDLNLNTEDLLEVKLLSPAAVEKLLPSKRKKELEELYTKTEGAPTLVPDTHPKPALDPATLASRGVPEALFADLADME